MDNQENGANAGNPEDPFAARPQESPNQERRKSRFMQMGEDLIHWTFTDLFDWNPGYVMQIRGILNICHVLFSMVSMSLVSSACQLAEAQVTGHYIFSCKSNDVFLFVVACQAFVMSTIFLLCCLLSKRTDQAMLKTPYELILYVLYFFLFVISAGGLLSSVINRNSEHPNVEENYGYTVAGAVFGLFACGAYLASAIWFYMYNRYYERQQAQG